MRNNIIYRKALLSLLLIVGLGTFLFCQNINRPNISGPSGAFVNSYTGNLFYEREDISLPGTGLILALRFSYNSSRDTINRGYGLGWSMNYGMEYSVNGESLKITNSDGRRDVYVKENNTYINPIGIYNNIEFTSPSILQLTTKTGVKYLFENNQHNKLTKILDRNNNFIELTYTNGYPSTITNSSGNQITLVWNSDLLVSASDGSRTVMYNYNNEYLTEAIHPLGSRENYQYDLFGKMVVLQDKDNYPVSIEYNSGKVSQLQSCVGKENFIFRDLSTYHIINANSGNQLTNYVFDSLGNNIEITLPHGGKSSFEYDSNLNLSKVTNANGNAQVFTYDANGNIISTTNSLGHTIQRTFNQYSDIATSTDENGNITSFTYDNSGNVLQIDYPDGSSNEFTYYANGLLQNQIDGNGNTVGYTYDANGNLNQLNYPIGSIDLVYDIRGNVIQQTDQDQSITTLDYDLENRLISITNPDSKTSSFVYDGRGNLNSVTDFNGNLTLYTYDGLNRIVEIVLPVTGTTQYQYDQIGNIIKIVDGNLNTNIFKYNAQNLVSEFTDGIGNTTLYEYDIVGNQTRKTDPNGNSIDYSYDINNRLLSVSYPQNTDEYQYDSRGNIVVASNNNITYNLTYDALDRLKEINNVTWDKLVQYEYDGNGNRSKLINPDNENTDYAYTPNNLLSGVTNPYGSTTIFMYDVKNRLISQTNGNATLTNYEYSELDYLLSMANLKSNGDTLSSFIYEYDDLGNRLSRTKKNGLRDDYTYDTSNRLTNVTYDNGDFEKYGFDNLANRTYKTTNSDSTNYTYNAADQLVSNDDKVFSYDMNGNTTQEVGGANTITNIFDALNRLISNTSDGVTSIYKYDPFGRRVESQIGADSTLRFIYDIDNILLETDENNNNLRYYTTTEELDSWLSFHANGQNYYYHKDGLSSTINITSQTEDIVNEYAYDSYGNISSQSLGIANRILYTGRELDTDYYYYRSRYYNPEIGRFLTKDNFPSIISLPITHNKYIYTNANPITFNDPSGEIIPAILAAYSIYKALRIPIAVVLALNDLNDFRKVLNKYSDQTKDIERRRADAKRRGDDKALSSLTKESRDASIGIGIEALGLGFNLLLDVYAQPFKIPSEIVDFFEVDPINPYDPEAYPDGTSPNGDQETPDGLGFNPNDIPISIDRLHAVDPNDIIGPKGYDTLQWMSINDEFGYTIRFENDPEFATGPAQIVKINCPIDDKMNLASVRLGTFSFGDFVFNPPPNSSFYADRLDVVDSLNVYVDITAGIDINKKEVFWILESIDPITGLAPLEGDVGFLPVNDTTVTIYNDTLTQQGEGYVTFTVNPKSSDITGDTIYEQATIIFDQNEEIPTNIWSNIIDAFAPQSMMDSLPINVDSTTFTLNWSAEDDPGGVGVASYDLYISVDENEYYLLQESIDTTLYEFTGEEGSTYSFYIRARDHVGNIEAQKFIEDTKTTIGGEIIVNTKVILQGPYDESESLMRDLLRSQNLIPLSTPYIGEHYPYGSIQEVVVDNTVFDDKGSNSIIDWIYVEIFDMNLDSSIAGKSCLLQRDGDIVGLDGELPPTFENLDAGFYQLIIYHRNHLPIKTKDNIVDLSSEPTFVNLSNDISILIGGINAIKEIGGNYSMIAGDVDQNGQIQNTDKNLTLPQLGIGGYLNWDIDMNGEVQQIDINNFLIPNLGRGKQFDNE